MTGILDGHIEYKILGFLAVRWPFRGHSLAVGAVYGTVTVHGTVTVQRPFKNCLRNIQGPFGAICLEPDRYFTVLWSGQQYDIFVPKVAARV